MSWSEILNHEKNIERFRRSSARNRLASTYLFVGPAGVGKKAFAIKLAQALLCETNPETDLDPCGSCPACQQVMAGSHPDLIIVSRPKDKNFIPVETFIGDREHRRREGLCHDIGLKAFCGGRKVAIIDDADFLNQESANSLLKTLEEPPPKSVLILIGTSEQRQLPTILSRSQIVRFGALTPDQVSQLLSHNQLVESDIPLEQLAVCCEGSIDLAIKLSDKETFEFRQTLFLQLATHDPGQAEFAKTIISFVDAAGKDAAEKRNRLTLVGDMAISFYRHCNQAFCGGEASGDADLDLEVANAIAPFQDDINRGCQMIALCIQRTMDLQWHVTANVNNANAIASWLTDIGRICREQFVEQVATL